MDNPHHDWNKMPWWCWVAPLAAGILLAAKSADLFVPTSGIIIIFAIVFLGGAVFAAVHHAEVLAIKIGQPLGSILLALAITTLEVGLIISVMVSNPSGNTAIARDTIYSVVMIVLNGIVGLCLLMGAERHYEQEFKLQGAVGILSVIATLAIISLVLPNFTQTTLGPTYAPSQLLFVGSVSFILYVLFVFVQSVRHRQDFLMNDDAIHLGKKPTMNSTILASLLLLASLIVVILLAKTLAPTLESLVLSANLPLAVVGVVIATIVLLPEGITAIKAARRNALQTSLNVSLGSAAASIGLTVPIVGGVSTYLNQTLTLGLGQGSMVLILLTLFISTLTFATGRTTVLQGAVHLVIFGVFLFLSVIP